MIEVDTVKGKIATNCNINNNGNNIDLGLHFTYKYIIISLYFILRKEGLFYEQII